MFLLKDVRSIIIWVVTSVRIQIHFTTLWTQLEFSNYLGCLIEIYNSWNCLKQFKIRNQYFSQSVSDFVDWYQNFTRGHSLLHVTVTHLIIIKSKLIFKLKAKVRIYCSFLSILKSSKNISKIVLLIDYIRPFILDSHIQNDWYWVI